MRFIIVLSLTIVLFILWYKLHPSSLQAVLQAVKKTADYLALKNERKIKEEQTLVFNNNMESKKTYVAEWILGALNSCAKFTSGKLYIPEDIQGICMKLRYGKRDNLNCWGLGVIPLISINSDEGKEFLYRFELLLREALNPQLVGLTLLGIKVMSKDLIGLVFAEIHSQDDMKTLNYHITRRKSKPITSLNHEPPKDSDFR